MQMPMMNEKKIVTEKSECQIQEYVIVDMGCGSS